MIIFLIKNCEKLLTGIAIIALLSFFYMASNQIKENQKLKCETAKKSEEIKQQKTETKIKNDIIETKNFQQKLIRKTTNSSDVNDRLKWLQLVYAKGNNHRD